jgi:hypothetical protein
MCRESLALVSRLGVLAASPAKTAPSSHWAAKPAVLGVVLSRTVRWPRQPSV